MSEPSAYQLFWENKNFAFVGHSAKHPFPTLSFGELKKKEGKKVFAVDPSIGTVAGEKTYPDLASLPEAVDAVVLEVPKEESRDWVEKAAEAGIKNVWIHMECDSPEAVALAKEKELNLLTGTCAVMYLKEGFSFHSIHKWIMQLLKKY